MNSRYEIASKEDVKYIPTYNDIKLAKSSGIFEAEEIQGASPEQVQSATTLYEGLVQALEEGKENEIDEGILGGLAGGAVGALAGPAIGKAICKVLGIDPKGNLGRLLTSRLVTTALGYAVGKGK